MLVWPILISACSCGNHATGWECRNHGSGRLCTRSFDPPGGGGWECYVAHGDLACAGGVVKGRARDWSCKRYGERTVCVSDGAARPDEPSPDGWQCQVEGGGVACAWRREGNGEWICSGEECSERHPDYPSADEWECIEGGWGVLCRGRFLWSVHPRWRCKDYGDRYLCLDLDPDYPHGARAGAWKCHYDNSARTGRLCTRRPFDPCIDCPGPCLDGFCFPAYWKPVCFFDDDCPSGGRCYLGVCM